jgi:hypothetical protein
MRLKPTSVGNLSLRIVASLTAHDAASSTATSCLPPSWVSIYSATQTYEPHARDPN